MANRKKNKTKNKKLQKSLRKNSFKNKHLKKRRTPFQVLFRLGCYATVWFGIFMFLYLLYLSITIPDVNQIRQRANLRPTITFLDAKDRKIATYGDSHEYVLIENMPDHLLNAVVSIEDRKFYEHSGFDIKGFSRAMLVNIKEMRLAQGGSTITQQLAKNLFLTNKKTIGRKIQEIILALYIETKYSKDEILESYLNNVYLGAGNYGVESAAKDYFDKNIYDINFHEAIILAGLLKAPSAYSPKYHKDRAFSRAVVVAEAMEDNDLTIPTIDFSKVVIVNHKSNTKIGNALYFTDMVSDLSYGYIGEPKQNIVIKTTYNLDLQRLAEESIATYKESIKNRGANQIAFVSMQKDGGIVSMMGGFDYNKSQFNRSYQAKRQTGSAFKPIVYLAAIEKGATPTDIIQDMPIKLGNWAPENFDSKYHGDIEIIEAFSKSYNIPAVKIMKKTGVNATIGMARRLGITSKLEKNLTTALGSNSVSLLELTNAYTIIANKGYNVSPYAITSIKTDDKKTLYKKDLKSQKVLNGRTLKHMNLMLKETVENGSGKNAKIRGVKCYGKTGTTQDYRDAWFIGYTNKLTTGIWIGNDNSTPTDRITGGSFPAKIWKTYNKKANKVANHKNARGRRSFWNLLKDITKNTNAKPHKLKKLN